jgi:hemin uptake protein HemP
MAIVTEGELLQMEKKIKSAKTVSSVRLFANKKELLIEHLNETYILRITKQNKLILTK